MPYSCIVNLTEWRALSAPLSIFTSPRDILSDHSGGLCIVYSLVVSLWSAFFSWLVCWMLFRVSFLCSQLPVYFFANPPSSTFFYLDIFIYLFLYPIMCNFIGSHCGGCDRFLRWVFTGGSYRFGRWCDKFTRCWCRLQMRTLEIRSVLRRCVAPFPACAQRGMLVRCW